VYRRVVTDADRRREVEGRRRKTARRLAGFDESLACLSLTDVEAPLTRSVLEQTHEYLVEGLVGALGTLAILVETALLAGYLADHGFSPASVILAGLMELGGLLLVGVLGWAALWLQNRTRAGGDIARNRLIRLAVEAVGACARARRAPDAQRGPHLREVDRLYRAMEQCLLWAHRTRRTMVFFSPRRAAARQHAAWVAGALRKDLRRLDVEPDNALVDLAGKLVRISERYAQGRVGSLLAQDELEGVQPLPIARKAFWESAHMVLVLLAAVGGAVAAHRWGPVIGVPEATQPLAMVIGALVGATAAGGWQRAVHLKELITGN